MNYTVLKRRPGETGENPRNGDDQKRSLTRRVVDLGFGRSDLKVSYGRRKLGDPFNLEIVHSFLRR
jgi:hypothetical protein